MVKDIKLAGINFYNILAEKNPDFKDQVTINPSINISNVLAYKMNKIELELIKTV